MNKNLMRQKWGIGLLLIACLLVISWVGSAYANTLDEANPNYDIQIDPQLLTQMNENGRAGYLIYFKDKADLSPAYEMDWEARGHFVVDTLRETAELSQRNVRAYLDHEGIAYRHFWIDNIVAVESSDINVLNGLLIFSEIDTIQAKVDMFLIEPEGRVNEAAPLELATLLAPEPNLVQVKAPDVWALGIRGQGTVIANIDSGVRYTHNALVNQYRGNLGGGSFDHNFNWLDPDGGTVVPTDTNGHGTHVMGTMVGYDGGANEIGVAPEADWIACRGCLTSSCPQTALLACAEWIAAPYAIGDPGSADPDLRPHAVNNSWGNCQQIYNNWYQGSVDAWHAAGIVPIFANGNSSNCGYSSPPGLNTVGNPARYGNVTGVGSSGTSNGMYAPHSNWGPTDNPDTVNPQPGWADLKPQVIAPGVSIRSSLSTGDSNYGSSGWTGTSMSAPHVAGMIALMWQAAPCLIGDYATTETIIEQTATPIMYDDLGTGPRSPNYATGWGEINVLDAVQQAQSMCGPSGSIEGTVTEDGTGTPVAGASIEATLNMTTTLTATSDGQGDYLIGFAPVGTYEMTASAFGYLPTTVSNVEVISGSVTIQDFALTPAPSAIVDGTVTDVNTGWPLYARIDVDGVPGSPFWTDPATGYYSISLPEGSTYDFTVSAFVAGYLPEDLSVGPVTGDMTVNVELDVNGATCNAPGYQAGSGTGDFYDFEADDGGFVGTNDWEWGTYSWAGTCGTAYPPPGAYSGTNMWGTVLNDCYNNLGDFSILSFTADLTGQSSAILQWWDWYDVFETFDYGEVYANNVLVYDRATGYVIPTEWEQHQVDLTPFAGGMVDIEFRMFATTVVERAGWWIDDVLVGEPACTPQAGSLVVGNVYDENTNDSLSGAMVVNDSGYVATAVDTPDDPAVDDGFYTLFAPEGSNVLTATIATAGYGSDMAMLTVNDGETVHQDFDLPAGWLQASPAALNVDVELGSMATYPLTLTNSGGLALDFALSTDLEEHFESSFPPSGWSVIDNGGNCVWQRNDQVPNGRPNYAGGDGFSAAADSDRCGSGSTMDTELHSPAFDLVGASTASLDFIVSYRHLGTGFLNVDISADGGDSWDNLLSLTASLDPTGPGAPISLDLADYLGMSDLVVRYHYGAAGWYWWAQVDQVQVMADGSWLELSPDNGTLAASSQVVIDAIFDTTDVPEPGQYTTAIYVSEDTPYDVPPIDVVMNVMPTANMGLLEGTVSSQGYCDSDPFPAAGASVLIESATNTWNRTADEDGYYFVYLDASYSPLTVTVSAPVHATGMETGVMVGAQMTTTVDFDLRWLVPCVSASDDELAVSVLSGSSETLNLTIFNDGGGDADFEFQEQDGGYSPTMIAGNSHITDIGDAWETMAPLPAGRVFNTVVADQNGYVYVIGGTSNAGGTTPTNTNYRYDTNSNTWSTMAPMPASLMSLNGVEVDNKIYIPGDATTATTYVYDIATDSWSSIPANGGYTARSQYQIVAMGTDVYVLGGIVAAASASTTEVWVLDTTSETWSAGVPMQRSRTSFSAAAIDGEIYVAGGVAFPGFAPDMTAEKFDGATWSYIAPVPDGGGTYTRWSYNAAAHGADGLWLAAGRRDANWNVLNHAGYYNPDTDTWTVSPDVPALAQGRVYMEGAVAIDGYFYVIGGRDSAGSIIYSTNERLYVGSPVATDVDWLSQDPEMGTVPADDSFDVEITFTAFPTMPLGIYTATLSIVTNDPVNNRINIPVTMYVVDTVYGVALDPAMAMGAGDPGDSVDYTLTITNTGGETDTFDLMLSGNAWDSDLSTDSVTLAAGESTTFVVTVQIPAGLAGGGHSDSVTVTAVSTNDPSGLATAQSVLTTEANEIYRLWLPIIIKP
jgi:subtilisin family serine protease